MSGATGFLGSFVLCEFLRSTRSYLYCLARVAEVGGGGVSPAEACRKRLIINPQHLCSCTSKASKLSKAGGLQEEAYQQPQILRALHRRRAKGARGTPSLLALLVQKYKY